MTTALLGTATGTVSQATIAFTVPVGGVAVGVLLTIAAIAGLNASRTLSSVADSKGNTWTVDVAQVLGTRRCGIASAPVTVALVSGDTITATFSGNNTSRSITVWTTDDPAASTVFDAGNSANGTGIGTAPTVTTSASSTQASEVAFGAAVHADTETYTQPTSWNEDLDATVTAISHSVGSLSLSAPASITYDPDGTSITSTTWGAAVATYRRRAVRLAGERMRLAA